MRTIVGGEHHQCIFVQLVSFQLAEDSADAVLQLAVTERIYGEFPKKREPKAAKHKIQTLLKAGEVGREELLAAVRRYAAECADKEPKYIKYPCTWLNRGCWADEPDRTPKAPPRPPTPVQRCAKLEPAQFVDAIRENRDQMPEAVARMMFKPDGKPRLTMAQMRGNPDICAFVCGVLGEEAASD